MKKLNLLAAVLVMALVAVPASASVQNVKISGSVDSTYLLRKNFDFGIVNVLDDTFQALFLTQTTLRVDADLTDQVSATIALINERVWNSDESPTTGTGDLNGVDLYLAYVTLREMLYSPLTLVIGRQDFRFGNSAIMDSTGSNNLAPASSGLNGVATDLTKQTSLDAIRATLDYNPLTVDLLYIVVTPDSSTPNADFRDSSIFGTNLNYQVGDDMDSEVETYFWYKNNRTAMVVGTPDKADKIKVVGLRGSTNPIEGLNVQIEWAHQGGTKNLGTGNRNKRRNAQLVQGIVNYQVPAMEEYNPVLQYVFTKVTGDKDQNANNTDDSDWTGWDPFFEAQGGGTIYNTLFNFTNLIIHSVSLTANPMEDVTAKLAFHTLFMERELEKGGTFVLRTPRGGSQNVIINKSADSTYLGKEIDFNLAYDYTEDVQFGLALGWFLPGSVFTPAGRSGPGSGSISDDAAKQALVNVNVSF